jgi:hypothetical protein
MPILRVHIYINRNNGSLLHQVNLRVAHFTVKSRIKPLVMNESFQSVPLRILLLFEFKLNHCCLEIFF